MSFRVIWRKRTVERLDTLTFLAYELGRDGDEIRQATAEINARLGTNPSTEGESRDGSERVLIVHPMTVIYEVFEATRVVMIYAAVYYPRYRA
jgi:hypothetical protein